jgi:hypothetical protein
MIVKNVVLSNKKVVQVSPSITANVISSTKPVILKNIPTLISGGNDVILSSLSDVNVEYLSNGSILIYNSTSKEWVAGQITLNTITGTLDGGLF